MKYLFFDIECANCFNGTGKVCEFGYTIIDAEFNIIQQEEILINPKSEFDWFVFKKMLTYSKKEYEMANEYWYYFDKIKNLLEAKDTIVIGHTTDADAKYLADESIRYNLPFINFDFIDCKYIDKQINSRKRGLGVEDLLKVYNIESQLRVHKASDDAVATMQILKAMCEKEKLSIDQIIEKCKTSHGSVKDGCTKLTSKVQNQSDSTGKGKNKISRKNYIKFHQFLDGVKLQGDVIKSEFTGKAITISMNYEVEHYTQMLSIIQLLTNHGAEYKKKATLCDFFVKVDMLNDKGEEKYCSRLKYVTEANDNGSNIQIISFEKMLDILNVNMEMIEKMDFPEDSSFLVRKSVDGKKNNYKNKHDIECCGTCTIGEILKMKGVDII